MSQEKTHRWCPFSNGACRPERCRLWLRGVATVAGESPMRHDTCAINAIATCLSLLAGIMADRANSELMKEGQ